MRKNFLILISIMGIILFTKAIAFEFGFGTKGFIRKTLEKGQQEGKIPYTKQEKEKPPQPYYVKVKKFDLTQAKYLFVSAKQISSVSAVLKNAPVIIKPQPSLQHQNVIFKIKENGEIEEVKITDENGNRLDVNVNYVIKMSTTYLSVGLEVRGVWVVSISTQLVPGTTQVLTISTTEYVHPTNLFEIPKKYLVRIEDGAAWSGDILPDQYTANIEYDDYGNFYFVRSIEGPEALIKLNTSDMSWQKISAQGDRILKEDNKFPFWVDKFGNCLYYYSSGSTYGYKYRKITSPGKLSTTITEIPFSLGKILLDSNRDKIFYIRRFDQMIPTYLKGITIGYIQCNGETNYEIQHSSFTSLEVDPDYVFGFSPYVSNILSVGNRKVTLMVIESNYFRFSELNLENGTTNYYYEIPFSSFGATQPSNLLTYYTINPTKIYALFKVPQGLGYKYSFYAIYPLEQRYETIYETTRYAMQVNFWEGLLVDKDGSITINANDLQNEGVKVLLKIIPGQPEPQILQSGTSEIHYLIRVW